MRNLIAGVMLLAFALNAAAQKTPAKKPARQVKKAAPAAVPAKTAAVAVQPAKKEEDPSAGVLEKLKSWDARLESLKADFTQEVNFKEAGLKQSIEGALNYVKPNFLRIEHLKPARQVVVTDKTDIWIYKPEDKQAVRTTWEAWRRTQDQNFSGILDFGNYSGLAEKNNARVEGGKDGAPWLVTFTPRSGGNYTLSLRLSATDYFPMEAELTVDSTVIRTSLISTEKNSPIDPQLFRFAPPKGVEVIEFKN